MKNLRIISAACLLVSLFSCSREVSDSRDSQNPSDSSGKLVKMSLIHLPDSFEYFVRNYQYEPNNKIKSITTIQRFKETNGVVRTLTGVARFYRDASGRIERIGSDPDTSSSNVLLIYPSSTSTIPSQIKYTRNKPVGIEVLDSVVCSYSATQKLTKEVHFVRNNVGLYDTAMYVIYTYDSRGNLAERQQYSDSAGNRKFELNIAYSFEYDDKLNPLFFDEPGYFFFDGVFGYTASPNNVVKQINHYKLFPSDQLTYSFTYNSGGRPIRSLNPLGPDLLTRYYYE
jgi:hypothetical protein